MASFGLSAFVQAIISSLLLTGVLVLYLHRFAGSRWWLVAALGSCAADQLVKVFLLPGLRGRHVPIFHHAITFVYFENREQGFGGNVGHLLAATIICACALILLYDRLTKTKYAMSTLAQMGFALMIGGYLGILIDRVRLGFVMDFIDLGRASDFVYNIADLSVFVALALLVVRAVKYVSDPANRGKSLLDDVLHEYGPSEAAK